MKEIDEAKLNPIERLGLAYCRLNTWEWDDLFGPKPDGFDNLPDYSKLGMDKRHFISPAMDEIASILPKALLSKYWWVFELGKTEDEWREWYYPKKFNERKEMDLYYRNALKKQMDSGAVSTRIKYVSLVAGLAAIAVIALGVFLGGLT